jgi:hypothetical protein
MVAVLLFHGGGSLARNLVREQLEGPLWAGNFSRIDADFAPTCFHREMFVPR